MHSKEYRDSFRLGIMRALESIYGKTEIWAFHLDYENIVVSSHGRVKNYFTDHEYAQRLNEDGYCVANIYPTGNGRSVSKLIHRLVAETFLPQIGKSYEVNHIDGNKANNNMINLEWVTRAENLQHARDTGLFKQQFGRENGRYKYSDEDIQDMVDFHELGFSYADISKAYGLSGTGAFKTIKRRTGCPKYR
jgi:hypothetical protein